MDLEKVEEIIEKADNKKILVIGDAMLDIFTFGSVNRISPESPGVIFMEEEKKLTPGGAANVAENIASLGGKVTLVSVVGKDQEGKQLKQILEKNGIEPMLVEEDRPTTAKERFVEKKYNHQMPMRKDKESVKTIQKETEKKLTDLVEIGNFDAVAISDYKKGMLTEKLVRDIIDLANAAGKKIIIDPKPDSSAYIEKFKDVYIIKSNKKETDAIMSALGTEKLEEVAKILNTEYMIETKGEEGLEIYDKKGLVEKISTKKSGDVVEISGAGDTVIAGLCLSTAAGANIREAAFIANLMAGIVVKKATTAQVTQEELLKAFEKVFCNG